MRSAPCAPLMADSESEIDKESCYMESNAQPQNSPQNANFNEFFAKEGLEQKSLLTVESPKEKAQCILG